MNKDCKFGQIGCDCAVWKCPNGVTGKYDFPDLEKYMDTVIASAAATPGTIYGINRSEPPVRLSGMTVGLSTGFWPIPKPPDTLPCFPEDPPRPPAPPKTGYICTKCGDKNDFAEANQPDGTYQCSYHKRSIW